MMRFPMAQITYVCDMCEFGRTIAIQKFILFIEDGRTPSFGFPCNEGLEDYGFVKEICSGRGRFEQRLTF